MIISRVTFLHEHCTHLDELRMAIGNNLYNHHKLLWTLFPDTPQGSRPFLFQRIEESDHSEPGTNPNQLQFIVVSEQSAIETVRYWKIESKPYTPDIKAGQQLEFRIRVNPIKAKKVEGKTKSSKHDIVMFRKKENKVKNINDPMAQIIYEEGLNWIQSKGEKHGFKVQSDRVLIHSYRQHILSATEKSYGKPIRLSTLQYDGVLEVNNQDAFRTMLFQGLGPAKAFGCGLMLIKNLKR